MKFKDFLSEIRTDFRKSHDRLVSKLEKRRDKSKLEHFKDAADTSLAFLERSKPCIDNAEIIPENIHEYSDVILCEYGMAQFRIRIILESNVVSVTSNIIPKDKGCLRQWCVGDDVSDEILETFDEKEALRRFNSYF